MVSREVFKIPEVKFLVVGPSACEYQVDFRSAAVDMHGSSWLYTISPSVQPNSFVQLSYTDMCLVTTPRSVPRKKVCDCFEE